MIGAGRPSSTGSGAGSAPGAGTPPPPLLPVDRLTGDLATPGRGAESGTGGRAPTDPSFPPGPVALVALANLDAVSVRGDVIIASTVNLTDGSGFSTDPIACHADPSAAHDDDDEGNNEDDDE